MIKNEFFSAGKEGKREKRRRRETGEVGGRTLNFTKLAW
jgi:hypothetical protein